ncbi:MAG: hypothetical protein IKE43_03900 [Coriobacteriales bacterium]|nr:hypothetical protein [Coriobacteriales bacterium]
MIWFTADTHFGHQNIIAACKRPWETADQMNEGLIANINNLVMPYDTLYILGDFSYRLPRENAAALRSQIHCKHVHLVNGNHDKNWDDYPGDPNGGRVFESAQDYLELKLEGGRKLVCFHYPLLEWASAYRDAIHVHGHIHSLGSAYNEQNRAQGYYRYDVGVDANNYYPVALDDIVSFFNGVTSAFVSTGRSDYKLPAE